jgi:hypothetical protein
MTPEQFFALLGEPDLEVKRPVDLWFIEDDPPDISPPIVFFVTRGGQKVVFRPRKEEQHETAKVLLKLATLAA